MRYDLGLAWRNIRTHWVETLIPVIVVGLAIGLSLTIFTIADGLQQGIILASDPFGVMVIGPKGSAQELVTNTVLLQGNPVGTLPYSVYEGLEADERVRLAVPLAFADNIGGAKIIGTNLNFFELRRKQNEPPAFQLEEGRFFSTEVEEHEDEGVEEEEEHQLEAVLGSKAAEELGLSIGDRFTTTHGYGRGIASDEHHDVYVVVGILKPTDTPYDSAVYTYIENVWEVHAAEGDSADLALNPTAGANEVTSILVLPRGFVEQNQIFQEFYVSTTAQAAYPGKELTNLFRYIQDAQELLNTIAFLVLGIAAFTVFLAMYSTTVAREQAIAIMRSLGSRRSNVFRVIIFETLLISVLGAAVGRLVGYSAAVVIADFYSKQSALPIPIRIQWQWEALLWVLPMVVGALAGIIPAIMAYRVDVVEKLFPS
jgi:putative ABC transport system permease protein